MARHAIPRDEVKAGPIDETPPAAVSGRAAPRPLDPLVAALARAVDRLEGTAG